MSYVITLLQSKVEWTPLNFILESRAQFLPKWAKKKKNNTDMLRTTWIIFPAKGVYHVKAHMWYKTATKKYILCK